jgi:para-nitrobenzyl esterase
MRMIAVISQIILFTFLMVNAAFADTRNLQADTSSGLVEGTGNNGVVVFKGIPYAEPPVGARRFQPSVIKEREQGVILAHDFGPACLQEDSWKVPAAGVSEDCLSINIWAPDLEGEDRPVMVWIHGGSYIYGSGADPRFNGEAFARRGDVVLVTLNYRLGILGFLDFSEIGGSAYQDSVNNGLKDQMLALEWIRDNIASFSGDPDNVTVFGESAGGGSIAALLGTDNPEKLFDRVIVQSRPILTSDKTAKIVAGIYKEQAAKIGMDKAEDWLSMSEDDVFKLKKKVEKHVGTFAKDRMHSPTYGEGLVVPVLPEERLKTGHASNLELIIGTTMNESRLWAESDPTLCERTPFNNELTKGNPLLGLGTAFLSKVIKMDLTGTEPDRKSFTNGEAMLAITDEIFFRIPSFEMADAHSDGGGKTYMYIFEYPVNRPENCQHNSSPHAVETPFVFNNINIAPNQYRIGPARDEEDIKTRQELADATQDTWISFAKSGDPNLEGSMFGVWPLYESNEKKTFIMSSDARVVLNPFGLERKLIKMAGAEKTDFFEE